MTDKELLELAAKAAGIYVRGQVDLMIVQPDHRKGGFIIRNDRGGDSCWNPLTDDGDALRLAVKLNIDLNHSWVVVNGDDNYPMASIHASNVETNCYELKESDPFAATRRAIVTLAAELAKSEALV